MSEPRTGGETIDTDSAFRNFVTELAVETHPHPDGLPDCKVGELPLDDPSLLIPVDTVHAEILPEQLLDDTFSGEFEHILTLYCGENGLYALSCRTDGHYQEGITGDGFSDIDDERGRAAAERLLKYLEKAKSSGKLG